jgi:hypothetical protein
LKNGLEVSKKKKSSAAAGIESWNALFTTQSLAAVGLSTLDLVLR